MKKLSIQRAINEAMREEMRKDSRIIVLGEDVGRYGGHQEVTMGLFDEFGQDRVIDTPISEAVIAGAAVGAAIGGLRPIAEIQHIDFIPLALDAIVNHGAVLRYAYGGQINVPVVIRTQGGSHTLGTQHSKSLESWLVHIPGLKVVMPSCARDAKGLMKSAIRDPNPVVFIEHKLTYRSVGELPEEDYEIPIGVAEVKRVGSDVTLVATSKMVEEGLLAAQALATEGISVEVVDPRTILPLDMETISRSLAKTGRLVVVSEGWKTGGFGNEVVSRASEEYFHLLKVPPIRLGAADVPIPFSAPLEKAAKPGRESIAAAIKQSVGSNIVAA